MSAPERFQMRNSVVLREPDNSLWVERDDGTRERTEPQPDETIDALAEASRRAV